MKYLRLVIVVLALAAFGCAGPVRPPNLGPVPSSGLKDGRYQAEAEHSPAYVKVEIEIKNGRLVNVNLLQHRYGLGGPAGEVIPGRIVKEQSTDVDAVSGATGSSVLIMTAVQAALDQARIDRDPAQGEK